jgi:uncharacterized damage-inducible protein DinB
MHMLFRYNWKVRDEWFELLEQIPEYELQRTRVGGMGSILHTLFHIVKVEQAWILGALQQLTRAQYSYDDYSTLDQIKELSSTCRIDVENYVQKWSGELEKNTLDSFTFGEVMRHVIAHEIHHIGQLSIWVRELGYDPVSANLIGRGLT